MQRILILKATPMLAYNSSLSTFQYVVLLFGCSLFFPLPSKYLYIVFFCQMSTIDIPYDGTNMVTIAQMTRNKFYLLTCLLNISQ